MSEIAYLTVIILNISLLLGVVQSQEDVHQEADSTTSVIIILGFIGVLLILSGIGIGCSYLCYRRSQEQFNQRAREVGEGMSNRMVPPPPLQSLEAKPLSRGIPNWYGPAPETPPMNQTNWGRRVQLLHSHTNGINNHAQSRPPS